MPMWFCRLAAERRCNNVEAKVGNRKTTLEMLRREDNVTAARKQGFSTIRRMKA